jgi:flagellar hook-associated protein 3 FlgL
MYLRTTTLGTTNSILDSIFSAQEKYLNLSEQASSGLKVAKPSDNPVSAKSILDVNSQLSQLNKYLDNMSITQTELDTQDSTLGSVIDLIQQAKDLATQAASETYSTVELNGMQSQVDSILDSVLNLANTQYNGNYIFSGTNIATQTYTTDAAGNITYNGTPSTDVYERYVQISDGVSLAINQPGDQIFGSYDATTSTGTGVIGTLKALSNALGSGDYSGVNVTLSDFTNDLDTISLARAKTAAVINKFSITSDSINATVLNLTSYKSDLEDIDLSEVLAKLAASQAALQVTMSTASQILQGSNLLDYL